MNEVLFKVLIIGDATVGKTSFVDRYVHSNSLKREYKPTVGVDFALKVIQLADNVTVRLQLWDIAGQERFTSMTRVYYKGAAACLIMFDLTQPQTFNNTLKWKKDLDSKCALADGRNIPCILVANKCDLPHTAVEKSSIEKMCKENAFLGWTEMSVKEDKNVKETMDYLLDELMAERSSLEQQPMRCDDQGGFINLNSGKRQDKRACCS